MNIIEDTLDRTREAIAQAREIEFKRILAEYNLTPQNMKEKGYELVVETNADGTEIWKLCTVVSVYRMSFEYVHDIVGNYDVA
jgi:hypothetical protein